MQILFEDGGGSRELDIQVNDPAASVGDLAAALDPEQGQERQLLVDGRPAANDLDLRDAGLCEGAVVTFAHTQQVPSPHQVPPDRDMSPPARRELAVVNGLEAGVRLPLPAGDVVVGRGSMCTVRLADSSVSRQHVLFRTDPVSGVTTVQDMGSNNGTFLDADPVTAPTVVPDGVPLTVGATQLTVQEARRDDRPAAVDPLRHAGPSGMIPFNRPPRQALPPPPDEVRLPRPPRASTSANATFSALIFVGPLMMAIVMYVAFQRVFFLLFALMSPILGVGRYVSNRRRGKQRGRADKERYRRELRECQLNLREAAAQEAARRASCYPDPAEVVRRAAQPSVRLWERRPEHEDFLHLRVGTGVVPWDLPVPERRGSEPPPEEQTTMLQTESVLYNAALPLDVSDGKVVGIVGDRAAALSVARSLVCQAAILHGPADMPMMVLASQETAPSWDWTKWFPHVRSPSGDYRMLSADPTTSAQFAEAHLAANESNRRPGQPKRRRDETGPTLFVVVDDVSLTEGRRAPVRDLLRGDAGFASGVVIASTVDRLPALCTSVVDLTGAAGDARLSLPQEGQWVEDLVVCGMPETVARSCARSMARYEDPELDIVGAGLPSSIRLLPLLGLDEDCTSAALLERWRSAGVDPSPAGPIGMGEDGPLVIDFVADGPHALVGGTTGAGKSELLRSLVAGMASNADPDHLTFLLVDFKGGSAFDECARLPHTVGVVTDLDEHLAERALRCLEAELRYRERLLRDAGASDLPDYLRHNKGDEPLPRLMVIIDEFATLKAELPNFIDALVGVAQRGRSLGVHMLLATQRPQGAISENIKANTNMRIALRMQDNSDSNDVIGVTDAAAISRNIPGRAYVRLGPGEVVGMQSALSTGARDETAVVHLELGGFVYGPLPRQVSAPPLPAGEDRAASGEPETDLSALVGTIRQAFEQTGRPMPRRPWPEPLPDDLDLEELIEAAEDQQSDGTGAGDSLGFVPAGLVDDPDDQRQYPVGWVPADGNLVLYGIVGSGTTTALASLALTLTKQHRPDQLHLYVLDFGAGELAPLEGLPHCGGVVMAHDRERQLRTIRMLQQEIGRRRQLAPQQRQGLPRLVMLIDGWAALRDEYKDLSGQQVIDDLIRVITDGPEVGAYVLLSAERGGAVSSKITSTVRQRWVFRMADNKDYGIVNIRSSAVPEMVPGHALMSESKLLMHVARPRDGLVRAVARWVEAEAGVEPVPGRGPVPIRPLPTEVALASLDAQAHLGERPWRIPVGLAEADLSPASLVLYQGEHALVAGPPRSGKSTALLTIAEAVLAAEPEAHVALVATPRSPLLKDSRIHRVIDPSAESIGELQDVLEESAPVVLVLIDDADAIEQKRLDPLGTSQRPNLLVVAAARGDAIRMNYSHWTRSVRRSKAGILLRPEAASDGELLGCRLPRRPPVPMTVGRGYVVNSSEPVLAQMGLPDAASRAGTAPTEHSVS